MESSLLRVAEGRKGKLKMRLPEQQLCYGVLKVKSRLSMLHYLHICHAKAYKAMLARGIAALVELSMSRKGASSLAQHVGIKARFKMADPQYQDAHCTAP